MCYIVIEREEVRGYTRTLPDGRKRKVKSYWRAIPLKRRRYIIVSALDNLAIAV